jgi:tetratricopeptide (TPR) repeat protein
MSKPFRSSKASGAVVLLLLLAVGAVFVYWRVGGDLAPGDYEVRKGNYRLEDGQHEEALREFGLAIEAAPENVRAYQGVGATYLQLGRLEEAEEMFSKALALDASYAIAYADRGIALDRMGRYEDALGDYRKAIEVDPDIVKGPGFLWRFMRNISEKPPSIQQRADYIEAELKKPPGERLLSLPEKDSEQRMYKK